MTTDKLPKPGIDTASHAGFRVRGYTADQMRAYAAEQVAAVRERCAKLCEQVAEENTDQDSYHWSGCMDCKEAIEKLNVEPTGCRSQSVAARS